MAVTTGREYDHLNITQGENTVRHPLKDTTARAGVEGLAAHFADTGKVIASGATANANYTLATGSGTASGEYSTAVGKDTQASGLNAFADGNSTIANHKSQHVSGEFNVADTSEALATERGEYVEIIGNGTDAANRSNARTLDWSGNEVLAGDLTINAGANDEASMSDIVDRVATLEEGMGGASNHFPTVGKFVAGSGSVTSDYASATGQNTVASGVASHADGTGTVANHRSQHAFGEYNVEDISAALAGERGLYIEVVGNGTSSENKSNARTLDWNGNETLAGNLTTNGNITTNGTITLGGNTQLDATTLARLKNITITTEAFNSLKDTVDSINETTIPAMQSDINKTGTGLTVDLSENKLYLTHNGVKTGTGVDFTSGLGFDTGRVDDNGYVHIYLDNQEVEGFTPFYIGNAGGGASGGGSANITRIGDASIDCVYGDDAYLEYNFTATNADGETVGNGVGTWYVNGVVVASNVVIRQGNNTVQNERAFNIGPYLTDGQNTVRLQVVVDVDADAPIRTSKSWTINAVNLYFTWSYDDARINTDDLIDRWTTYGGVYKVTHTLLDGYELEQIGSESSGDTQEMRIPMQSHGAHGIERWVTATVNGATLSTKHQYHSAIFVEEGNTTPIVAISMQDSTSDNPIKQYDTIEIPVVIYDPSSLTADAVLRIDGQVVGTWTNVGRTVQTWAYTPTTPTEAGTVRTLSVTCGTTTAELRLIVEKVEIGVSEIGEYSFRFKASDIATNNAAQAWSSNGINATFSDNFDWINGGLKTEMVDGYGNEVSSGGMLQQYFCVKAGTTMTINHNPFVVKDPKLDGLDIKIVFKVKNVRKYDTQIAHCFGDNAGLRMYAHEAILQSPSTSVRVPYGEDEYTELEFDIYKAPANEQDTENFRYLMAWADGVITSYDVYGENDNFIPLVENRENIIIGSEDCDVNIYMIKVYPRFIARKDHIKNFIADAPNASQMIQRYNRNNILVNGEINPQRLAEQNPDCRVWMYDIPKMTRGKDIKVKGCSFTQIWQNGDEYYQMSGTGEMSVQGTSSVDYIRGAANTDINFSALTDGKGNNLLANSAIDKNKYGKNMYAADETTGKVKEFTAAEAIEAANVDNIQELGVEWIPVEKNSSGTPTKYIKAVGMKINDNSSPVTYLNTKVNFASCEQVNNMCNAEWYQMHNPYPSLTPRDCMEFAMGVQFISDRDSNDADLIYQPDGKYHMYSIANMGNSKKDVHVFHDLSNPNECCIEVNNNLNDMCRMITVEGFDDIDWTGKIEGMDHSFGMRYPDVDDPSAEIKTAWKRFVKWMADSNPWAATDERLKDGSGNNTTVHFDPYVFVGHDRAGRQVLQGTSVTQYAGDYTHDTFEYRMAKMLSECEDYLVMDSVVYHFLYLERHTMVDNVAKNTFWSSSDLVHWDLSKAYDMDTSDGNNNEGELVFDYGNEYDDMNGASPVFNAQDSVWFRFIANLYEACKTVYDACDNTDTWSAKEYHNFLLSEQRKVPECVWVQCYWLHYIRTYEQGIESKWRSFLAGGQKTHQRGHYEYFQDPYIASKYRSSKLRTTQSITLRGYSPEGVYDEVTGTGIRPKGEVRVKMYNKMYCIVDVDGNIVSRKINDNDNIYTINFENVGRTNDTVINIYPANFVQEIYDLAQLYPAYTSFSNATRLKSLEIGSGVTGYTNPGFRSVELDNNGMLEYLDVRNLPDANSSLNLSKCPLLKTLYADGSGFTTYQFANGGSLSKASIEKPVALIMQNMKNIYNENFDVNDYSRLSSIRIENVPNIDTLSIVNAATVLQIARLIGVNWTMQSSAPIDRLYLLQGYDDNGFTLNRAVITGNAYVNIISERNWNIYKAEWEDFNITYGSFTYTYEVSFYNADGNPILDLEGKPYVQIVGRGEVPEDPVTKGYVNEPTMDSDAQYIYTYAGWDSINDEVYNDKRITATYTTRDRTYTVRWYDEPGGRLLKTATAKYGDDLTYNGFPTYTARESNKVYYVFTGWDKSTGFIDGSSSSGFDENDILDVYATWDIYALKDNEEKVVDSSGTTISKFRELNDMSVGQIYAIAKNKKANSYWDEYDYVDVEVGKDYNFSNVDSRVIAENMYFDGTNPLITDIQLFKADAPTFTLAIDYEFASDAENATLASCYEDDGNEGFRLIYSKANTSTANPRIQWGSINSSTVVGYKGMRGIVVLKHKQGDDALYVYSDKNSSNSTLYSAAINKVTLTRSVSTETDAYLTFGDMSYVDMSQETVPETKGWIHWCKIWYADLGESVTEKIANWPHETWRMHYYGSGKYIAKEGDVCAASFVANALLPLGYGIVSSSGGNAGGWPASTMRTLTNGRCFNALPTGWQFIVRTVQVPSSVGTEYADIVYAEDKLYIPAIREVSTSSMYQASPYAQEGSTIGWFTSESTRIKFRSLILPSVPLADQGTYITKTTDPSVDYDVVPDGTVWYNSAAGYTRYYVNQSIADKHWYFGNTSKYDASCLAARNANGGYWITSASWVTRSPYVGGRTDWMYVSERGVVYSTNGSSARGVLLCFSI